MRTRIVLCLLLNLAVGSADAQATISAEKPRALDVPARAPESDSAPPPRATEQDASDNWLIRGESLESVPSVAASNSRRPLQPAPAEERRQPGWIIPADQSRPVP